MKNRHSFLTALLLSLYFSVTIQAQGSTRFQLTLGGLLPRTGEETEKSISLSESFILTNTLKGLEPLTNWRMSLDLKFKDKFSIWDESNDCATVEMVVDHFLYAERNQTNELVKPKSRLVGTFIAGEWFFRSLDGSLSEVAAHKLTKIYNHPHRRIEDFDCLKLNQPRSIGESWKILPDLNKLKALDGSVGDYFTRIFIKGLNTNNFEMTAQFIGITNVSGFRCFDLRLNGIIKGDAGKPTKIAHVSAKTEVDIIVPLDASQRFWTKRGSVEDSVLFEDFENGKMAVPAWGKGSAKLTEECRGVSQK
ncbi:MAG: hypothetical protein WCS42_00850 [Verrucomicrobiota bacterium]